MNVSIFSLRKILYQGEAIALNCKTASGEITVLENHVPLITQLTAKPIKITTKKGEDLYFPVSSGFLEVRSESEVRCLVEE